MLIILLSLLCAACADLLPHNNALHFVLQRRGGRFASHEPADLTKLLNAVRQVEPRYSSTYRQLSGNRLIRKWTPETEEKAMLIEAGLDGHWYTTVDIGDPPQALEFDIDLLNPDFYTILTTSEGGSKFNTFASQSHVAGDTFVHPLCRLPSDRFHVSHRDGPVTLDWPICQPSKSSRHTLFKSGTILGLAPNSPSHKNSLSRLSAPSALHQLYQKGVISSPMWSITFLDSDSGVLSVGGTLAAEIEEAKTRTEVELKYMGQEGVEKQIEDEVNAKMAFAIPAGSAVEDHFKWADVAGASGWWTGLISGVWVNGVKVLKNQPFLLDPTCPFVMAPPTAFRRFYDSIGGSKPLSAHASTNSTTHNLEETFHLFPCLNPPAISLEMGGWPFPLASSSHTTREDAIHGPAGGLFSLGKVEEVLGVRGVDSDSTTKSNSANSGFCVGIVIGSDMGERTDDQWRRSGMKDTWVLGEPFFRGMGVAFDDGEEGGGKAKMGFRSY